MCVCVCVCVCQVRDAVEGEIAQAAKDARRQAKAQRAGAAGGASGAGGSGRQLSAGTTTKYNRFEADVRTPHIACPTAQMLCRTSTACMHASKTATYSSAIWCAQVQFWCT